MPIVYCQKCKTSSGRLCAHCKKGVHQTRKSVRNYGAFGCAAAMRNKKWKDRVVMCEGHHPPLAECEMCHVREPAIDKGYAADYPPTWHEIEGLMGKAKLNVCPSCHSVVRVGLDWSLDRAGEPLLSESIACAFAFQIGQASGRHTKAEHFEVMSWQLDPKWLGTDLNRWDVGQP